MMKTSAKGRAFIEGFEGLILGAYDDANDHIVHPGQPIHGVLTIGYGHTTAAGAPKVFVGQTITREQADEILSADLGAVENDVNRLVRVQMTQGQFDALVSFQFNLGALAHSNVLAYFNMGKTQAAADAILQWDHARQHGQLVRLPGLTRRRQGEKAMFLAHDINGVTDATTEGMLRYVEQSLGIKPDTWDQ